MLPITIIIPVFNRKRMLIRAIDSVLHQSLPFQELIVVDDGSTDGTADMLYSWAANDISLGNVLRLIRQENRGVAAARNTGIHAAKGEYLAFLDSDDHWKKDKLEKQFTIFEKTSFLISHTKEIWFRNGKHLNQKKIHAPHGGDIFTHCLQLCAVGMSTVMARREFFNKIGLFDEDFHCCEDYDLWLRASSQLPFLLVDIPLTIKEGGREDQLSRQYRVGMDELRIKSIRKIVDSRELNEEQHRQAVIELCRKLRIFGEGCIKHGWRKQGEEYLQLFEIYHGNCQ